MRDARLNSIGEATGALAGHEAGAGKRFMTATFTIKNCGNASQSYYNSSFHTDLTDADGERAEYTEALLRPSRDGEMSGDLAPRAETNVWLSVAVPQNVAGKTR